MCVDRADAEQRIYASELLARLSPFAQSIVEWRWLGYSKRKIAEHLDMDHTAVRRAYSREVESLLSALRIADNLGVATNGRRLWTLRVEGPA